LGINLLNINWLREQGVLAFTRAQEKKVMYRDSHTKERLPEPKVNVEREMLE
jgi:hypothetical protein